MSTYGTFGPHGGNTTHKARQGEIPLTECDAGRVVSEGCSGVWHSFGQHGMGRLDGT